MTTTVKINSEIYKALEASFGETALNEKLDEILISAIESKLEKYNKEILTFEAKYGVAFSEFARMWSNGKVKDPYSYEIESDYIDWEMLEMEKKDLISAIRRMKKKFMQ